MVSKDSTGGNKTTRNLSIIVIVNGAVSTVFVILLGDVKTFSILRKPLSFLRADLLNQLL